MLLAFNKPYGVLSQFNENPGEEGKQRTLAEFGFPDHAQPLGRLDLDSEGLLLLSDEKELESQLLHPKHAHRRRYFVLVDGKPDEAAINTLRHGGIAIKGHMTLPCSAKLLTNEPDVPPRQPPLQFGSDGAKAWIELELREGKNRQVRRMTAATGHPTLRLIRISIGDLFMNDLAINAGEWCELGSTQRGLLFAK